MRSMVMGLGAHLTRGIERSVGGHLLSRFEDRVRDCGRVNRETLREILSPVDDATGDGVGRGERI